jgi:valyl-tRNA synthetase
MNKKLKYAILAMIIVLSIFATIACGKSGDTTTGEKPQTGGQEDAGDKTDDTEDVESEDDDVIHPMRFVTPGNMPPDAETGLKALNEKLQADGVNIEVIPIRIPWDAYDQKINLENELARVESKLSNDNFVRKAPPEVVEQEREKRKKYQDMMDKVLKRIESLKK